MNAPALSIAVSGASGLVGSAVCRTLLQAEAGIRVRPLVRDRDRLDDDAIPWSSTKGVDDPSQLEGLDAVVHLAGVPIGPDRWTEDRKRAIRDSRVEGTRLLCEAMAACARPPRVLVQASAVGYYGHTGDAWADESSPQGEGFLAGVCRDWEAASQVAEAAGVRVLRLRFGHVLGDGGLLQALRTPTKLGLGGRLGPGTQYWSWIAIDDLVSIILTAIADPSLSGVLNAVSPEPVTNATFAKRYAAALHRPAWLPAPATALKLVFGKEQAHEMLLWGQRVRPGVLQRHGFHWSHAELDDALAAVVGGGIELPVEQARALAESGAG